MSKRPTLFFFRPQKMSRSVPGHFSLFSSPLGRIPLLTLLMLSAGFLSLPGGADAASSAPASPPVAGSPPSPATAPLASANVTLDNQDPVTGFGVISLTGGSSRLVFFPDQDVFTPLLANPREPLSTIEFFVASNNPSYIQFNGNVAADIGIVRWESNAEGVNRSLQFGISAGEFSRFGEFGANTYLIDADYLVGATLTGRLGPLSQRLFFYHESSHTGYDYTTLANLNKTSDFGQEILQEVTSWDVNPHLRLYGGAAYRVFGLYYYSTAQDSLILLGGVEAYSDPFSWLDDLGRAYTSFFIESRGINGYTPDEDFQLGLLFHRPGSYFQIRPMIDFYNGYSYMGDLLFTKDRYAALGVSFDF
ncbi:MAG: DUF1207 domain-containing protein [Leptospirillia bacterium]